PKHAQSIRRPYSRGRLGSRPRTSQSRVTPVSSATATRYSREGFAFACSYLLTKFCGTPSRRPNSTCVAVPRTSLRRLPSSLQSIAREATLQIFFSWIILLAYSLYKDIRSQDRSRQPRRGRLT